MDARIIRAALAAAAFVLFVLLAGAVPPQAAPPALSAADLLARNAAAAGGEPALGAFKALSFVVGASTYLAASDGRLNAATSFPGSPAFERVAVARDGAVRRNILGRVEVPGAGESARWRCLARLFGGAFTPRLFPGPFSLLGTRSYGPARHHLLATREAGADVVFSIDASDFLVKRMIVRLAPAGEDPYELSCEFDGYADARGLKLPSTCFFSQVGQGGTGAPSPRPLSDARVDPEVPAGGFDVLDVDVGPKEARPGELRGRVVYGAGDDDERIAVVFTNWGPEDVERAGLRSGDRLAVDVDGFAWEATFFAADFEANVPGAYDPGRAMLTRFAARAPLYHLNFSYLPREAYEALKPRFAPGRPVSVRSAAPEGGIR